MKVVNENNWNQFKVDFKDVTGANFIPQTVRYRLDDKTCEPQRIELIGWTTIQPQLEVDIAIPASANRILDDVNPYEVRVITVQSDYDTDNQLSTEEEYRVRNLAGFQ
jgi:hypothetical protein